ncbi:MAG: hypothetical protein HY921_09335 [Elusimicrobia bacterium]|nr:hypothetical protein [Elusimicrobiota bacterium]
MNDRRFLKVFLAISLALALAPLKASSEQKLKMATVFVNDNNDTTVRFFYVERDALKLLMSGPEPEDGSKERYDGVPGRSAPLWEKSYKSRAEMPTLTAEEAAKAPKLIRLKEGNKFKLVYWASCDKCGWNSFHSLARELTMPKDEPAAKPDKPAPAPATPGAKPKPKPAPAPTPEAKPEGVSDEIWDLSNHKPALAEALQNYVAKSKDSSFPGKLKAASQEKRDGILNRVLAMLDAGKSENEVRQFLAYASKTLSGSGPAAGPAGSPGGGAPAGASPGPASPGPQAPPAPGKKDTGTGKKDEGKQENPINTLAGLLKDPKTRDNVNLSIAERFFNLTAKPRKDKKSYITDEVAKDKGKVLQRLKGEIEALVKSDKGALKDPMTKAELYFVVGADKEAPSWAQGNVMLKNSLSSGAKLSFRSDFDNKMADWTGAAKAPGQKGQYVGKDDASKWTIAFFTDGASQAHALLNDPRVKKEIEDNIKKNFQGDKEPVPGTPDGGQKPAFAMGSKRPLNVDDLYINGARTAYLPIPGTYGKKANGQMDFDYRRVSLKLYTEVVIGADGYPVMTNKVDVEDISVPGDDHKPGIFGRRLPIPQGGTRVEDANFHIDDRVSNSHAYKVVFEPNGDMVFTLPDAQMKQAKADATKSLSGEEAVQAAKDFEAKWTIKTSVSDLYNVRREQIAKEGWSEEINGQYFRVFGQGGPKGAWLYYKADKKTGQLSGTGYTPGMMAYVNKVGANGVEIVTDPQALGFIGKSPKDPTKDQYYYQQWNREAQRFEYNPKDFTAPPKGENTGDPQTPPDGGTQPPETPGDGGNPQPNPDPNGTTPPPAPGGGGKPAPGAGGKNDPQNPSQAPSSATPIEKCNDPEAFSNAGAPRTSSFGGKKWSYWVNDDGMTYYCLYGNGFFASQGYLANIAETDSELRVTIVTVENPTAGVDRISLESIREGVTIAKRQGHPDVELHVSGVSIHYLPKKGLLAKTGKSQATQFSKVGWLVEERDKRKIGKKSELRVYTDENGPDRVKAAMAMLIKNSEDSGVFGGDTNAGNREKLFSFLNRHIAQDKSPLKETARPHARINLHIDEPSRDGQDVIVYWNRATQRTALQWVNPQGGPGPHLEDPAGK